MGNLHRVAGSSRRGLILAAAVTSALLSLLFLVVYSTTNWLTSQRGDVGTWYYEWERFIPFVPLFIVPYMSIDLFFIAAPFLCRDRRELGLFARRVSFAIVVAGICFLLVPLQLAVDRPAADGWLGAVFDWFRALDQPHNLFPSLHITLRLLLAEHYARHSRRGLKIVLLVWFSLIDVSTLLTHQHHVVDIAGGFVLAAICFYLMPEASARLPAMRNFRVAAYYGIGTAASVALALATWPWGGLLLWPATALAIMTAAYAGLGPGVFRKTDGRLPLSTRLVLGPVLLGQYLSLLYYRRRCQPWNQVVPGVLMGRTLSETEAAAAIANGVTAVLDLTAEFSESAPFRALAYRNAPVLDLTAPRFKQLLEAVAFITEHARRGIIYVHCKVGYSRSAAIVGAYLLARGHAASAAEVVSILRRARPSMVVRPEAIESMRRFQDHCRRRSEHRSMAMVAC
jgi:protein-tyrosine phosphatase/membrane-associated phospholipid phosphatase